MNLCGRKKLMVEIIALMIVQAVMVIDIAWAAGIVTKQDKHTLSPALTINSNSIKNLFSSKPDTQKVTSLATVEHLQELTKTSITDYNTEEMRRFLQQSLPIEANVTNVQWKGVVLPPEAKQDSEDFRNAACVLNAGGILLGRTRRDDPNKMRVLLPRVAVPRKDSERRTSFIDLVIHEDWDKVTGKTPVFSGSDVPLVGDLNHIEREMLSPYDHDLISQLPETKKLGSLYIQLNEARVNNRKTQEHSPERLYWSNRIIQLEKEIEANTVIALEDARAVERDNGDPKDAKVHVYLTVVFEGHYYSAQTNHDTEKMITNINKRLGDITAEVDWQWSPLKKLINDGPCADQNIKNFVPFGNPAKGIWHAIYRPSSNESTVTRLAVSKEGLAGTWYDAGEFFSTPEGFWGGGSAFVAELPGGFEMMLIHSARGVENGQTGREKDYDLWMVIVDVKNPRRKFVTGPILKADQNRPFETDKRSWHPGAIYSCFAVLVNTRNSNDDQYEFDIDIYYSAADTAIVLAAVTVSMGINNGFLNNTAKVILNNKNLRKIGLNETSLQWKTVEQSI